MTTFTIVSVLVALFILFVMKGEQSFTSTINKANRRSTNPLGQEVKAFQVKKWNQAHTKKAITGRYDIKTLNMTTRILREMDKE